MEPMAIVTFTGGVLSQIGILIVHCRPVFEFFSRLISCLTQPRPPPPRVSTSERIFNAIEERFRHPLSRHIHPQTPPSQAITTTEQIFDAIEERLRASHV
ncbi:hypothetical protein FRX31_019334 [Thalictrum thalictroides]|uniref:Uncharacterized protein n=1 Tax=Thalictrum thalictroides TaxID=46969 RepID=A0A7J6W423_THATH|nr:hypothetical protein FRX31_019334 [Thalictrum thalictroides]